MYQPRFPLKMSDIYGPYDSIQTLNETIKQNAKTLLMVSPGEWPGNPDLGVGLRRFLFENSESPDLVKINKTIKSQFGKYMPFLTVDSKLVKEDDNGNSLVDSNFAKLVLRYRIEPLNQEDYLEVSISE